MKLSFPFPLTACLLLVSNVVAFAQAPEAWVQHYSRDVETQDEAKRVAGDSNGNVIITGETVTGTTGLDWITIKYSANGVAMWTNRYDGVGNGFDFARGLVVDGGGNVFVTGGSEGMNGFSDFTTVAYSGAGVPLWTNRFDGAGGDDQANAIALGNEGNVVVLGSARSALYGPEDIVTIAYSTSGAPLWTNRYNGASSNSDYGLVVAADQTGNIFVSGSSWVASYDFVTVAYSGGGVPLWTNLYDGPGHGWDTVTCMATSSNGNVYIGGYVFTGSSPAYAVLGYSGGGVPLWTNLYDPAPSQQDKAAGLAVDGSGNVFVTGTAYVLGRGYDFGTVGYSGGGVPLWTNLFYDALTTGDFAVAALVNSSGNLVVSGYVSNNRTDYATVAYTTAGTPLWTNRYDGPATEADYVNAMAADSNGRVIVTGKSVGVGSFEDFATVAYSDIGTSLWTNRYKGYGSSEDRANAVAVSSNGMVILAGYSCSTIFTNSPTDIMAVAYSSTGAPLWTNFYDGPWHGDDSANAVAVSPSGNIIVAGYARNTNSAGNDYSIDYSILAYSPLGTALWTNLYSGPGINQMEEATAVAVAADDRVFVTGYSLNLNGYSDCTTLAYSGLGTPIWTNRYDGPDSRPDQARAISLGTNGNIFVTGFSYDINFRSDFVTLAYSADGLPLWTNRYNGPNGYDDEANSMATDGQGKLFVSGYSRSASTSVSSDFATVAYSESGDGLWTNRYDGPVHGEDSAAAVAVDTMGNVFVTGYSATSNSFPVNFAFATIAYSGNGLAMWTNRYDAPGNSDDRAVAVAVDDRGNVYVSGYSSNGLANNYVTIAYSASGLPLWTNLQTGLASNDYIAKAPHSLAIAPDGLVLAGRADGDLTTDVVYDAQVVKYFTGFPVVTSQPQSIEKSPGAAALFSVEVNANPTPAYQWRFNGGIIVDATNDTYAIPSINYVDAGTYDVIASNYLGSVTSILAQLTLIPPSGFNTITPKQLGLGSLEFSYLGVPGSNYLLERTFSLSSPVLWVPQFTNPAALDGTLKFTNTALASTNNFWRVRSMP